MDLRTPGESFGGVCILELEIPVAADPMRTVAVAPSPENVAVLGLIVLIRTFLSFSPEVEIEGVPLWRRTLRHGAQRTVMACRERRRDPGT
ncbi:MAG TPA: DUF1622 domain-containing protein [Frankiaceae bacterium]|nr:DUF1622 domain-containing protein [Frankiaceae bacterium]